MYTQTKILKESKILRIDDAEILQDINKQNYYAIEIADDNTKLFISESEADKYRTDATEWEKFFKVCETDADENILSNIQDLEKVLELSDEETKDLEKIIEDVNENNSRTDRSTSEIAEIYKRDTETKKTIVKKLRTLNVTHIHELEAKAYDFLKKDKSKQIDYEYLQDRCKETEIWSKIKNDPGFNTSECKNIKCKKDLLTFVNPVYFLNHLEESGISNLHAVELLRVQERIVKMKTLQENGPGIFSVGGYTFCNHAVFLTIRAVDGNYLNFTDKYDAPIDRYYKNYDSTYPYKESSYWCVVLKKQAANTKQTGIVELYDCKKIVSLANQGYVIIVAWENIYEGKTGAPHYATVQPNQINCNKIENILLCNVGKTLKMGVSIKTAFGGKKIKELHFFYDRNQDFREDYTIKGTKSGSIQELENRDGVFK